MKKKDISDFSIHAVSELLSVGLPSIVRGSIKSNSLYIHIPSIGEEVRISDHGYYTKHYNFTSSKKHSRNVNGDWFFPMDDQGIADLINVIKEEHPNGEVDVVKEQESDSGKYCICYQNKDMTNKAYLLPKKKVAGSPSIQSMIGRLYLNRNEKDSNDRIFIASNFTMNEAKCARFVLKPTEETLKLAIGNCKNKDNFFVYDTIGEMAVR